MFFEGQKGAKGKYKAAKKCNRRTRMSDMEEESDTEEETEKKSVKNKPNLRLSSDDDSDFDIPTQRKYFLFPAASIQLIPQCSVIAH